VRAQLASAEAAAAREACAAVLSGHGGPLAALLPLPLPPGDPCRPSAAAMRLLTLTLGGELRLWRVSASGAQVSAQASAAAPGPAPPDCCWAAASPCGSLAATADVSGAARLWRVSASAGGEALQPGPLLQARPAPPSWPRARAEARAQGHALRVTCGAFTADGAALLTGGADGDALLWRTADGAALRRLSGHTKYITSLALSPGDACVATGSGDGTVRVCELAGGALLDEVDASDSGAVALVRWAAARPPTPAAEPRVPDAALLSAHYDFAAERSRAMVRAPRVTASRIAHHASHHAPHVEHALTRA